MEVAMRYTLLTLMIGCATPVVASPALEPAYPMDAPTALTHACDDLDGPHARRNRTYVHTTGVTVACY